MSDTTNKNQETRQPLVSLAAGWDFQNTHVQSMIESGTFVAGKSVLLLAGPASLKALSATSTTQNNNPAAGTPGIANDGLQRLYPIALCQQFGFNQATPSQEIHEIGSERSYFIKSRTAFSANIGSVFYNGPNLIKSLYAYAPFTYNGNEGEDKYDYILKNIIGDSGYANVPSLKGKGFNELPGYGDIWLNLKSDLFNYPFGLAVLFADTQGDLITAIYIEDAFLQGHSMSIGATATIIMESTSIRFDKVRPIKIASVKVNNINEATNTESSFVTTQNNKTNN